MKETIREFVKGGMRIEYNPPIDEDEPNEYFIPYGFLDKDEQEEYIKWKKDNLHLFKN